MKIILKLFPVGHFLISLLFVVAAFALLSFAATELWGALFHYGKDAVESRIDAVLNSIAMLTISVASLELAQTIYEEEILRDAHISAPTRVRRFLSRFLVVLVVALSIEALVAAFKFSRDDPSQLPYAASIGIAAAVLLAAWGLFIQFNRSAELLEPEAMESAKREDRQIEDDE
jgi:hypothetical protein